MIETKLYRGLRSSAVEAAKNLGQEANKGFAFVERNWFLTKRYWAWEAVWITYNVVSALTVVFIPAGAGLELTKAQVNQAVLYLAIGTAVWTFLGVVFDSVTETVTMERWEGTIEYTFMAPISRITHMFGTCAFALLHGLLMTALQLLVLSLFFHLDLSQANWLTAVVFLGIGSFSFIGFGTIAAVLPMLYTERGAQMAYIVRALLLLVSGVYYSVSVLPSWLQVFSYISPATYVLDGLRQGIQQGRGVGDLGYDLWPLLLCTVLSIPIGLTIFNAAERYAKRTGKLKRNG
jgi:ABC-2 type transport system permease protein